MRGRHITTGVTLLVLCGLLVVAAVVGWKELFAELPDTSVATAKPTPSCTTQQVDAGERIRSNQVKVSVFNAGSRSGLANRTLDALVRRGFKEGEVGNAPSDAKVRRVVVWSTEENDAEARLVARQLGKRVKVRFSDVDLGPGVDVLVGDKFRGLVKAKRSLRVKKPQEVCVSPSASPTPETNAQAGTAR